tara:strand:- start:204 stop:434 length:231 start_codon:yes stop_codon:yes gene_type:complete
MSGTQENIDAYRHTLLAITELASDGVPAHEQIFAGISFYTHMAHGCAPSSKIAKDTIAAGIEYGESLHSEDVEDKS